MGEEGLERVSSNDGVESERKIESKAMGLPDRDTSRNPANQKSRKSRKSRHVGSRYYQPQK